MEGSVERYLESWVGSAEADAGIFDRTAEIEGDGRIFREGVERGALVDG